MKPRKSMISRKKKKSQKETVRENVYFDEELEAVEVKMIPEDQLHLNDAELDEEFTKTLTCLDPNQASKITHFNFKRGEFESRANNQHIAMHINQEGVIWSKTEREELEKFEKEQEKKNDEDDDKEEKEIKENENKQEEKVEEKVEENEDEKEDGNEEKEKRKKEILVKNQFNFSDRASQTFNEAMRDREIQTEPAPKSVFSQNANASLIRDEYLNNLLKVKQQQIEEENKKKKSGFSAASAQTTTTTTTTTDRREEKSNRNRIKYEDENDAILHSSSMFDAVKIMERVTVLNANSESYEEFRYYSDSDYKRGSFVQHLWTFEYSSANQMITCLEWNAVHLDLFGAGYGSYNFNQQSTGMICIYSLKSTAYPEKIISCESGVMSMSFHPKYSSLICVGLYDGSVAVYDVQNRDYDSPIYSSKNPETHHFDPVWGIKWYSDPLQHDLIFYSISSDSEIKIWKMSQNELTHETLIKLTTPKISINDGDEDETDEEDGDDDEDENMLALCSCFDFNPFMQHLYLVGTEDGHIMECNKTYNDGFTRLYSHAHYMNVYCIKWNLFHDKIFLSCSQDWTIKLWEINNKKQDSQNEKAIITYDLGSGINDIAWAPFSSTIFAAVTCDGRLHIFDLLQNKNAPLCTQQITKKSKNIKLTKVSFPIGFPLIIVGDEKGNVYALKLSPNLYLNKIKHRDILKNIHPNMFNQNEDFKQKEKEKLINVLNVTGNKVFDVIQHFSPRGKKRI